MKYSYLFKSKLENVNATLIAETFDHELFISAYNESERVNFVFDNVNCVNKHWIIFPEYLFKDIELSHLKGSVYNYSYSANLDEGQIITDYYNKSKSFFEGARKVCIDITGFIRPYLVFLVRLLQKSGVESIQFIYTEPTNYVKKEDTLFSDDFMEIRTISGCLNSHNPNTSNDLLIVGSGYDYQMIAKIAKAKPESKKVQILGFPSLKADMFQENVLKVYEAQEDVSSGNFSVDDDNIILAPANDPFITAEMISKFIAKENKIKPVTNIYLCPLSTKAQTLGIALFYVCECLDKPASIIFPFSNKYSRETTEGIANILIYEVQFPPTVI
ncbi:hypothetical protein G4D82_04865 [Flavobacterium sp. CYK-4]|uniref:hypothetical protein n=1 Tax=Flavobacterium lotistagni TaxID=2709660 RepID=UPI00140B5E3C|nr:hypothetical protein [Flavobacterium lotistagni]NHM06543.1 hypothetical protein [Flavobacterium lotistagni]